jgi:hypothetical protein
MADNNIETLANFKEAMLANLDPEVIKAQFKASNQVLQAVSTTFGINPEKIAQLLGTFVTTGRAPDILFKGNNNGCNSGSNNCKITSSDSISTIQF